MFWIGLLAALLLASAANGNQVAKNGRRRQRNEGGAIIGLATIGCVIAVLIFVL
jgi:hypothetical protein